MAVKTIKLTLRGDEEYFDWVYNFLLECRIRAGVPGNQIYDYPEFNQYMGYFSYGLASAPSESSRVAYIVMPEDQFVLFKLKYCK